MKREYRCDGATEGHFFTVAKATQRQLHFLTFERKPTTALNVSFQYIYLLISVDNLKLFDIV